jgi:hypothetical protein
MTEIHSAGGNHSRCHGISRLSPPRIKIEHLCLVKRTLGQKWEMARPEYICLSATIKMKAILFIFIYQKKLILPFTLD